MKKIICLYGGPGSGKSTTMFGLAYRLKMAGFNTEINPEYIKNWVWEERKVKEGDQSYFFSKQARKERLLIQAGLDFIVTDSPLILTHYYGLKNDPMEQQSNTSLILLNHHHQFCKKNGYKVEHFFIGRCKPYSPAGRFQTEDQAKICDDEIKNMLSHFRIKFLEIPGNEECVNNIFERIIK